MSQALPPLRLKKNEERRLKAGHLWVYSNEIDIEQTPLKEFSPGTMARIEDRDYKKLRKWRRIENHLDDMQREITAYLSKIYQSDISEAEAKEISSLMRMTNNIERIGDSVENIAQAVEGIIDNKLEFSDHAKIDLQKISDQVKDFINLIAAGIQTSAQDIMEKAEEIENTIDSMREQMRQGHVDRIRSGKCGLDQGLVFINLLTNFEKVGDYCYNIAEAVAGVK